MGSSLKRGRGRPRRTLEEIIKSYRMVYNVYEDLVFDQVQWHHAIHVANLP